MPTNKFRQRNPKNRKTKSFLVFDEDNRRDFLSGFQKRKKERKRVAREQQELKYKEEKQRLRQDARKARQAEWKDLRFPDEDVEVKDGEPIVYDHAEHTVTVESVGGVTVEAMDLLAAHGGIGENKVEYEDDEDDDGREHAQSRLKALAECDGDDDDEDTDDNEADDAVVEAQDREKKIRAKKKSANLQKLQSKLNKGKPGHKGGQRGGHKGGHKEKLSRGVKRLGQRGKKPRGRGRGGHGGKGR